MKIDQSKKLTREQMQSILGGLGSAPIGEIGACTASCPDGTIRTCSGARCTATDGVGCSAETSNGEDKKKC